MIVMVPAELQALRPRPRVLHIDDAGRISFHCPKCDACPGVGRTEDTSLSHDEMVQWFIDDEAS